MGAPSEHPARRYYEALVGRWSGRFSFEVTDVGASLRRAPAILALGALESVTRGLRMTTTLFPDGAGFRHTTLVGAWKVPLLRSAERIEIDDDGRTISMHGEMFDPRRRPYVAPGEIAESADAATYRIPWQGVTVVQRTRIVGEHRLELVQETPFSRASVLLERDAS